ncbi:MAG: RNA polymerase sigma factor [Myxococcales bacterium]|nr:RNA polymerase sigma factor [Myxococcales bacterium]
MNAASNPIDQELLGAAQRGDRRAFDRLFAEHVPKLRGVVRRLVGHPDHVDDLSQQALLKAYENISGFRGEAAPSTWLCSIGTRLALDHLRARKRWREKAQVIFASRCLEDETMGGEVGQALGSPAYSYDVREHIAYCFTCVGRTLEPEAQAALVLRDVMDLSNDEAAKALEISTSVLRHHLASAREQMQHSYEGLCALVNKQGACWQCAGLREVSPPGKQGEPAPDTLLWPRRLEIVREAALGTGMTAALHEVFFRRTEEQEEARMGDESASTNCGRPNSG